MKRNGEGKPSSPSHREEAARLFRQAVEGAAPLPKPNRADISVPRVKPVARQRLLDESQVLQDTLSDPIDILETGETGEELFFARPGIPKTALRKLKRIIHGKGLSSRNREPVLKHKLRHWLIQREDVLAYCQARPMDGGSGAVIVLLKSANRNPHG
jgi:DNA-nicking Smr family endonuclease